VIHISEEYAKYFFVPSVEIEIPDGNSEKNMMMTMEVDRYIAFPENPKYKRIFVPSFGLVSSMKNTP